MKAKWLSLGLVVATFVVGAVPLIAATAQARAGAPDPAQQIESLAQLFRAGDLAALAEAAMPPSQWERLKVVYEIQRQVPVDDDDRAEFAEKIAKLTAPDAVDTLMAEIEPQLEEARPQVPGALLMGFGAMQIAVASPDSKLTDEQRAALTAAMPGIQQWASNTDFLDSDTMRQALTLLTGAARGTGIDDLDQLKALPLGEVLRRADIVLAAAKDAVRLYGIDLDAIADTLQVEVLSNDGRTARVRTTITVFDAPIWGEHDLVLVEGRWVGKQAVIHWDAHASHLGDF